MLRVQGFGVFGLGCGLLVFSSAAYFSARTLCAPLSGNVELVRELGEFTLEYGTPATSSLPSLSWSSRMKKEMKLRSRPNPSRALQHMSQVNMWSTPDGLKPHAKTLMGM